MAQKMHNAGLHLGLRDHRFDGIGEAVQPVDHGNQVWRP